MPADGHPGTLVIVGAGGLAQQYALGQLHPVNRQRAVEQRLSAVERFLVYQLRPHRRIWLNAIGADGDVVISDREAEYLLTSEDGSITLSKGTLHPTRNNVADLTVNTDFVCATCYDIEQIKHDLLQDLIWLDAICDYCGSGTPPPPWPT